MVICTELIVVFVDVFLSNATYIRLLRLSVVDDYERVVSEFLNLHKYSSDRGIHG